MPIAIRIRHVLACGSWAACCLLSCCAAAAQEAMPYQTPTATEGKPAEKKLPATKSDKHFAKKPDGGRLNPAREAAALAFVREHHSELQSLLASLKARQPKQYQAAIRDLFRHSERLANIQERDAARYEWELRLWKQQSRVELLSATVLMNPQNETAKANLQRALVEQLQLRREALALERAQLSKRLQKLDEQIERAATDIDDNAQRQLQAIISGARPRQKDAQKTSLPSAGAKPGP